MNRLPSPFASDLPTILTPQNSPASNSSGFLMMTRPPSASSDHSGRNKGMRRGRGNHWSNHSPQEHRGHYSINSSPGFSPLRHQGNYFNRSPYGRGNHNSHLSFRTPSPNTNQINYRNAPSDHSNSFRTPSPNTGYTNYKNTPSDHSNLQSTPNSSSKQLFNQKFKGNKNTPLKSIPIEKFVSTNMVKEPWGNLQVKSLPQQNSSVEDGLTEDAASLSESPSPTDSPSSVNSDVDSDIE